LFRGPGPELVFILQALEQVEADYLNSRVTRRVTGKAP
jgi:hypothetical protein